MKPCAKKRFSGVKAAKPKDSRITAASVILRKYLEIIHSVFLAATCHHIFITTGGFRQMSVEVLGLAFIYFIAHSPSAKLASLNCLFSDTQRIECWPADVVCLELQKP